jgi:hypothetical protein
MSCLTGNLHLFHSLDHCLHSPRELAKVVFPGFVGREAFNTVRWVGHGRDGTQEAASPAKARRAGVDVIQGAPVDDAAGGAEYKCGTPLPAQLNSPQ